MLFTAFNFFSLSFKFIIFKIFSLLNGIIGLSKILIFLICIIGVCGVELSPGISEEVGRHLLPRTSLQNNRSQNLFHVCFITFWRVICIKKVCVNQSGGSEDNLATALAEAMVPSKNCPEASCLKTTVQTFFTTNIFYIFHSNMLILSYKQVRFVCFCTN